MTDGRNSRLGLFGLSALGAVIPVSSHAQDVTTAATNLGGILSNASNETYYGPGYVLSVATFVVGLAVVMWGVIKLKEAADGQVPMRDGIWRITGGSLLMALPFMVNVVLTTLYGGSMGYGTATEGNYSTALSGYAGAAQCANGLDQCMIALVQNIYLPAQTLISVSCYILGGVCVGVGLYRLAQAGQGARGSAPSTNGTLGYIGGGSLLISLGEFMDIIRNSLFGTAGSTLFNTLAFGTTNPLPSALQTDMNGVFTALFAWVQLIGWLAFARGVYLLIKISQGNGQRSHSHAFTHIIGGALAVNMYAIIMAIQTTLGVQLVTPP